MSFFGYVGVTIVALGVIAGIEKVLDLIFKNKE